MRLVFFKTVVSRIVILMLCYAIMVTALIIAFSYYIVYTNRQRTNSQSAEFNLQLASQSIDRDLTEVIALSGWCSRNNSPARFLTQKYNPVQAVNSFMRVQEEFRNNRATNYIKRILIISNDGSKMLHLSDNGSNPLVLPGNNSEALLQKFELGSSAKIYDISPDPFSRNADNMLNILAPVYSTNSSSATAVEGIVYIAVDPSIITDRLKGYEAAGSLSLTIGDREYLYIDGGLQNTDSRPAAVNMVSCKIRDDMHVAQALDSGLNQLTVDNWLPLLIPICGMILILSAAVILMMNRTIGRPVAQIREEPNQLPTAISRPIPQSNPTAK